MTETPTKRPSSTFTYIYRAQACCARTGRERELAVQLGLRANNKTMQVFRAVDDLVVDLASKRQHIYVWRAGLVAAGWLFDTGSHRYKLPVFQLAIPECDCRGCRDWLKRETAERKQTKTNS